MPTAFSFDDHSLLTDTFLPLTRLTSGPGGGINDPTLFSALAPNQAVATSADRDVFAVSLLAGQTYVFDVDDGAIAGASKDWVLNVVDMKGLQVGAADDSPADLGSVVATDPLLDFTPTETGTYFVVVRVFGNSYANGEFAWGTGAPSAGGDYALAVSAPDVATLGTLTGRDDDKAYGNARQAIDARGGDDDVRLGGGRDVATGGSGDDRLLGEGGDDALFGGGNRDRLEGGDGNDALMGGSGDDRVIGGAGNDDLAGQQGRDVLRGNAGDDVLWGDAGDDDLAGGQGANFLRGGEGADLLRAGGGVDTFHFLAGESPDGAGLTGEDRVLGFGLADFLDVTDLRVGGVLAFVAGGAFTAIDQVRVRDLREDDGSGFQEVLVNLDANTSTAELAFAVDTGDGDFALGGGNFLL